MSAISRAVAMARARASVALRVSDRSAEYNLRAEATVAVRRGVIDGPRNGDGAVVAVLQRFGAGRR